MKKLIIIIVLLFSTLFNGSLTSAATAEYDHNELLDYPGYGEAMYESIVEQTTFISGRYTENKEYVNQSINAITDYAKGWWNEYLNISNMPPKEKLREMLNAAGGYALTIGDFIKSLFNDAGNSDNFSQPIDDPYKGIVTKTANSAHIILAEGYCIKFSASDICYTDVSPNYTFTDNFYGMALHFGNSSTSYGSSISPTQEENVAKSKTYNAFMEIEGIGKLGSFLSVFGVSYSIIKRDDNTQLPIRNSDNNYQTINNYIQDSSNPINTVIPQPKAYLSCPDGTRINMSINGGTFLDIKGQVMQVSQDGTATVDSQLCNLGWEKPTVQYVDGTDQVGITTPDGKTIDAETGEPITGDGEIDDSLEGCDGVLCGIGKLLSGLASIAKSIAGLVGKILDGLLALFVPDNLDFVSEEFDKMSAKFTDKFSLLTALKDTITGVFQNSDSGNPLSDVNMSLPAAPGFNFNLDTITFIEPFVPRVKQIISGILFLMTIIYVYRKITGRGGVMEK